MKYVWYIKEDSDNIGYQVSEWNLLQTRGSLHLACTTPSYNPSLGHGYNLERILRIAIKKHVNKKRKQKWLWVRKHLYKNTVLYDDVLSIITEYM